MTMEKLAVKYKTLLNRSLLNTPLRLAHFFTQISHESNNGKRLVENLNYSKERLLIVFKKYFTKDSVDANGRTVLGTASLYANNPVNIANRVYANRMGNGDEASGDGWKYRGRGHMMLTGKDNYAAAAKDTDLDLINNPDLLLQEANALIVSIWYWNKNNLNQFADIDNLDGVSDVINIGRKTQKVGDAIGYDDRAERLTRFKKYFGVK